jgi:prepilin-type N-terminal cleavage/methylation domain-containing protein
MMKHRTQSAFTPAFTLVEIMVSVAIFSIVMVAASAAYLNLIALDKQARSTNEVVDNLAFAIDSMARGIRVGTSYNCIGGSGGNCPAGGTQGFSFTDSSGNIDTYILNTSHEIAECTNIVCTNSSATPITEPGITISTLTFYVRGVGPDGVQPQVIIVINGSIATDSRNVPQTFTVETMTTERGIDS